MGLDTMVVILDMTFNLEIFAMYLRLIMKSLSITMGKEIPRFTVILIFTIPCIRQLQLTAGIYSASG